MSVIFLMIFRKRGKIYRRTPKSFENTGKSKSAVRPPVQIVNKQIGRLNVKKATGHDGIS